MLQIILTLLVLIYSTDTLAQTYQPGQVPAFLQNEATQQRQQMQQNYTQPNGGSIPAFLQQEKQQQQLQEQLYYQQQMQQIKQQPQYNYQSADPNSATFTLPPAVYQPAPGDVPAFVNQEQSPVTEPAAPLKTNQKEDTIQINFSEDQYKADEEVTTLNSEQATQYNTEVKQNATEAVPSEIPEGAKFEGETRTSTDATDVSPDDQENAEKEEAAEKQAVPEPARLETNVARITYTKDETELTDKDKSALMQIVKLLKSARSNKVVLKAFTSERDLGISASKIGLLRIIAIRDYLMKQGVDFSQTEVRVLDTPKNVGDFDYIDIDKI